MVLSAIFHTFNSHSREASEFCLMLDLGGISCSITASYISGRGSSFFTCPELPTLGECKAVSGQTFLAKVHFIKLEFDWLQLTIHIILSGIYYAFWCHPGLQYFYMLTVLGFILTGLVFRNTFNKDENLIPRF